jgi:hypothetical protein
MVFTKQGMLRDFYLNGSYQDLVGNDVASKYDGFLFSFFNQDTLYSANNFSYSNESIVFFIEYGPSYNYTFYQNNFELYIDYPENSLIFALEFYMTFDNQKIINISDGLSVIPSSNMMFGMLNWSNVTMFFDEGESLRYDFVGGRKNVSDNIISSFISNTSNTFTLMFDTLLGTSGNYLYYNSSYLMNFTFNTSNYVPKSYFRNISIFNSTDYYNVSSSYYKLKISKQGFISDMFFNNSDVDLLFDDGYGIEGICFIYNNVLGQFLDVSFSSFDNNSVTFNGTIANFKIDFYEDYFDLNLYVNQSYFIQFYFNPELLKFKRVYKSYSSQSIDIASNFSNLNWTDVSYESIEGGKLRMYLKNHPVTSFGSYNIDPGLNWYGNFRLFSFDSQRQYGYSFFSDSNYSIRFLIDLSNFTKLADPSYGVTINYDDSRFFVNTTEYDLYVDEDGIIRELYFRNSTRNMLGDKSQTEFEGFYLKIDPSIIDAYNCSIFKSNEILCEYDYGNFIYEFYNSSFRLQINTGQMPVFSKFYFTPNIDYMLNVSNHNNMTQYVDLSNKQGQSKNWTDVVFTTKENAKMKACMLYSPQQSLVMGYTTNPQMVYLSGVEVFTIGNDGGSYGGSGMSRLDSYYIDFNFNLTNFVALDPISYNVVIENVTGGYQIFAPNYRTFVTTKGILQDMFVMDSIFDIIGDNINKDGVSLTTSSGIIINATNGSAVNSYTLKFLSNLSDGSNISWSYIFNDEGFNVMVEYNSDSWSNIIFPVEISSFTMMYNLNNYSQFDNLSDSFGGNYSWKGISYRTQENLYVKIYLEKQPILSDNSVYYTYGSTFFNNNKQVWSLDSNRKMWKNNRYMYTFYIDTTDFINKPYNTISYINSFDQSIGTARYKLPSDYKSNVPAPVIVVLHDINGSMDDCFLSELNDYMNFNTSHILLCPETYGRLESSNNHTGYDLSSLKAQFDVINSISTLKSNFNVFNERISVIGMGTGGALALDVAAKKPDLFSGIATWNMIYNYSNFTLDVNFSGNSYYYNKIISEIGNSTYSFEYNRRSPISYADMLNYTPIWFYYNSSDSLYKENYTIDFYNILSQKGYNVTLFEVGLNSSNKNITPYNLTFYYLNFTYKNSTGINVIRNNTYVITDYSGNYFWYYLGIYYNSLGPDVNDTSNKFSTALASYNNNILNLNVTNIQYFSIPGNDTIKEIHVDTNKPITLLVKNANLTVYNSSDIYFDASYNLIYVNSLSGFVYNKFSYSAPFVYNATCSMINFSYSSLILNTTFNVSSICTVSFRIPNALYENYNIFENDVLKYQGISLVKTINITTNSSVVLMDDLILPSLNFLSPPTPLNATLDINRSPSFIVKVNLSEYVNLCSLKVFDGTSTATYSMTINSSFMDYSICEYNVTVLSDATNYTYYVEARDIGMNINYSINRTRYIDWNNAPTGNISFINMSSLVYFDSTTYDLYYTDCYLNSNCSDSDFDVLNYTIVINGSIYARTNFSNKTLVLSDGNYSIIVYVGDYEYYYPAFSNVSTRNYTLIIDTIKPIINITYPLNKSNYTFSSFSLLYNYTDINSMNNCTYSLNGAAFVTCDVMISTAEGLNNLTVFVRDMSSNVGNQSISFFVDSVHPYVNIKFPFNGYYHNDSNLAISFNATDVNNITNCTFYVAGVVNQTKFFINGNSSFNTTFIDGSYLLSVTCNDFYFNPTTQSFGVYIDTLKPVINITSPQNITYSPKYMSLSYSYFDVSPQEGCMYYMDTVSYSCSDQVNMTRDGEHNITLFVWDAALNNQSVNLSFFVNLTSPIISFVSPTPIDNSTTNISYVEINVTFDEFVNMCILEFDSVNYTMQNVSPLNCFYNVTGLLDNSTHNYFISANDTIGNMNVSNLRSININWNNAPQSFSLSYPSNNAHLNNLIMNLTWDEAFDSDSDILNYTLNLNGTLYVLNATYYEITLPNQGTYFWNVTCFDGQYYNYSNSRNFTIDLVNPQLILSSPIEINYTATSFLIQYSTDEQVNCLYSINSGTNNTCYTDSYYTGVQGDNNFSIYLIDLAGNVNFTSLKFYMDSIAPIISDIYPTNNTYLSDYNVTISFNVSDVNNNVCQLYVNGFLNETFDVSEIYGDVRLNHTLYFNNTQIIYYVLCQDIFSLTTITSNTTITFDTIIPNITLFSPLNISYISTNVSLDYISDQEDYCYYTLNNINYTCATSFSLVQGWNNFTITLNDSAANKNSVNSVFYVDSLSPIISNISPNNGNRTRFEFYEVSFLVFDISNVTCNLFVNGVLNQSKTNSSNDVPKYFTYSVNSNNTINWYVNCTDNLGNMNVSSLRNVTVDTVSPLINLTNPQNGGFYNGLIMSLNYSATENNLCQYTVNGNTFSCSPTFSVMEGNNNFSIRVYDDVENFNEINLTFFVDVNPPIISLYYPVTDFFAPGNFVDFNYSAYDVSAIPNCSLVFVNRSSYLDSSILSGVNETFTVLLFDGTYDWYVSCFDLAGNNNKTQNRRLNLDISPPYINISKTNALTGELLYLYIGDYNLTIANYSVDGNITVLNTTGINYFNISLDTLNWYEGTHFINVTAKDMGVYNYADYNVVVVKQLPTIIVNRPYPLELYNSMIFNISTAFDVDTLSYSLLGVNRTYNGTLKKGLENNTLVTLSGLSQGNNTVFFNFNDTLRNRGTFNITFFLDTLSPAITHTKFSGIYSNTTYVFKYFLNDALNITNCSIIIYANYTYGNYTVYNQSKINGENISIGNSSLISNITKLTWYNFTFDLEDGDIFYNLYCYDQLLNYGEINFTNFTVDHYSPIINVSNLSIQSGQKINITLIDHNITDAWYFFNGKQIYFNKVQVSDNTYFISINDTILSDGTYSFAIQAKDNFRTTYINTNVLIYTYDLAIINFSVNKSYYYLGDTIPLQINYTNSTSIKNMTIYDVLPNKTIVVLSTNISTIFDFNFTVFGGHTINVTMITDNDVFLSKSFNLLLFDDKVNQTFVSLNDESNFSIKYDYARTLLESGVVTDNFTITIPNETLNLSIIPNDKFSVVLDNFIAKPQIPIRVNISNDDLGFVLDSAKQIKLSNFTFSIDNYSIIKNQYKIVFNYSGLTEIEKNFSIYKTNKYLLERNISINSSYFNDTLNATVNVSTNVSENYTYINTVKLSPIYIDNISDIVYAYVTNFSQFVLTQDIFSSPQVPSSPGGSTGGSSGGGGGGGGMGGMPILFKEYYLNFTNKSTYNLKLISQDIVHLIFNHTYDMNITFVNNTFEYVLSGKYEFIKYDNASLKKSYIFDNFTLDVILNNITIINNVTLPYANVTFIGNKIINLTRMNESVVENISNETIKSDITKIIPSILEIEETVTEKIFDFIKTHIIKPFIPKKSEINTDKMFFSIPSLVFRTIGIILFVIIIISSIILFSYNVYPVLKEQIIIKTTRPISDGELNLLVLYVDMIGKKLGKDSIVYQDAISNIEIVKAMGTNKDYIFMRKHFERMLKASDVNEKVVSVGAFDDVSKSENNFYLGFNNLKHSELILDEKKRQLNLIVPNLDESGKDKLQILKERYHRLSDLLSQARRQGLDTSLLNIKFLEILPTIELYDATKDEVDFVRAEKYIEEIEETLLKFC